MKLKSNGNTVHKGLEKKYDYQSNYLSNVSETTTVSLASCCEVIKNKDNFRAGFVVNFICDDVKLVNFVIDYLDDLGFKFNIISTSAKNYKIFVKLDPDLHKNSYSYYIAFIPIRAITNVYVRQKDSMKMALKEYSKKKNTKDIFTCILNSYFQLSLKYLVEKGTVVEYNLNTLGGYGFMEALKCPKPNLDIKAVLKGTEKPLHGRFTNLFSIGTIAFNDSYSKNNKEYRALVKKLNLQDISIEEFQEIYKEKLAPLSYVLEGPNYGIRNAERNDYMRVLQSSLFKLTEE